MSPDSCVHCRGVIEHREWCPLLAPWGYAIKPAQLPYFCLCCGLVEYLHGGRCQVCEGAVCSTKHLRALMQSAALAIVPAADKAVLDALAGVPEKWLRWWCEWDQPIHGKSVNEFAAAALARRAPRQDQDLGGGGKGQSRQHSR